MMTSEEKAKLCARAVESKKAEDIVVSFIREQISITDYFVVCTVTNRRQMKAVSSEVKKVFKEQGFHPISVEGEKDTTWVLLDFDDVILHIFLPEQREYYALDMLWGDAPTVDWRS
jgi:ribosome-associated protein